MSPQPPTLLAGSRIRMGAPEPRRGQEETTVDEITVLDVGGTYLRWAQWSPESGLGPVHRICTPSVRTRPDDDITAVRAALVAAMAAPVPARARAAVSFGAALDHRSGLVYASAPLWGDHDEPFNLAERLRALRPDVTWTILNDVTSALVHLLAGPPAQDRDRVLLVTVSTGIACRTFDRRIGRLDTDGCGLQGEIGHLPSGLSVDGRPVSLPCDCGSPDHVASYSSGPGLQRLANALRSRRPAQWRRGPLGRWAAGEQSFAGALSAALDDGDVVATELLSAGTRPLADVLRVALCLDPGIDLIAVTGGVATSLGEHYRQALLDHLAREGLYLTQRRQPSWVEDRLLVCHGGSADPLAGAGLAAAGPAAAGPGPVGATVGAGDTSGRRLQAVPIAVASGGRHR